MQKQMLTSHQMVSIIVSFFIGSHFIMGVSDARQDTWATIPLGLIMILPAFIVYSRLISLMPEKDIYEMFELTFGKIIAKACTFLMTIYALILCSLVTRNYTEFIQLTSLPDTPQLPMTLLIAAVVVYIAKSGTVALGKWAVVVCPIIFILMFISSIFLFNVMKPSNILPFFETGAKVIVSESSKVAFFPFGEGILVLTLMSNMKKEDSPYKIGLRATIYSLIFFLAVNFRNIFTLGADVIAIQKFPSYITARIIQISDSISRVEGIVTMNYILMGMSKIAICLFATAKGVASLFNIKDYKKIVIPVALMFSSMSLILYTSTERMYAFASSMFYSVFAFPFQIIIPAALWITAEIKNFKAKKLMALPA